MQTDEYTSWQDGGFFIGHLNEHPEWETQGYSQAELIENLESMREDLESGEVPYVNKVEK